jgi:hypothetical protein
MIHVPTEEEIMGRGVGSLFLTCGLILLVGGIGLQIGLLLVGLGALFLVTGVPLTLAGISNLRKS